MIKRISTYFVSNESDFSRKLSKLLGIILWAMNIIISTLTFMPPSWLHYCAIGIAVITATIKFLLPLTGSDKDDLCKLKANQNPQ